MAPGGTPAFTPERGLPVSRPVADDRAAGRRSALVVSVAAYADPQLAWLRPPVTGDAASLAAALSEPQAGGYAVDSLANGTETEVRLAITRFLGGRSADETVLLYLSCHAIKDRARLYFAAADTWLRYPRGSAVPAGSVVDELARCGAGNRLLILDCCFIGGFAEEPGELDLGKELALGGRGVIVLSGSRDREYSYEGQPIRPELPRSVFTEALAVGLATGAADADGDGNVTVAEAYNYAHRHISQHAPRQAPQYYLEGDQGDIVLAGVPGVPRPSPYATGPRARLTLPGRALPPGDTVAGGDGPRSAEADLGRASPRPAPDGGSRRAGGAHESGTVRLPDAAASAVTAASPASPARAHEAMVVEQDRDNAYCVAFSPDGRLFASGGWGRPARIRESVAGSLLRELRSAGSSVYDLAFSPDGRLLATGGRDGTVTLCEVATGKKTRARKPGGAAVRALAFSPDGTLLVSAHEDGVARLWDVPALGRPRELRAGGETMFGAAFSPAGDLVAVACADGAVRAWPSTRDGAPAVLRAHTGWATGVTFSPDAKLLFSAGADGLVLLHDAVTGERSGALRAGDGIVNAIALSPDGSLLAAAYETGAVTVWDLASGRQETLPGHAGPANDVAFSPDGRLLASAGKDGTVRLWR
jgi:glucose/arabinose dehydrogenase